MPARLLRLAFVVTAFALAACSGSGSDVTAPAAAARPTLAGVATDGSATPVANVSVKGASGLARTARNSFGGNAFTVDLSALVAPYALLTLMTDGQPLVSLAFGAGRANLTPFTHLLVARMTAQDPATWYAALGDAGGPSLADLKASDVTTAEAGLRRDLARRWGVTLPAGALIDSAFDARAGDPMQDAIAAFAARLAARGATLASATAELALEQRRCRSESITLTAADGSDAFCPASKSAGRDSANGALTRMSFTTGSGDSLVLRLRGDSVAELVYTPAGGAPLRCTASHCSGVTLGPVAGDLSRSVSFAGTALGSGSARLVLDGQLAGAVPGVELPVLPCEDNRWYLIAPNLAVSADCTDSGSAQTRGRRRQLYTFVNGAAAAPVWVEVAVDDGSRVASVLIYDVDAASSSYAPRYRCLGTDCNGVSLSAPDAAGSRALALDDTRLAAVLADGSLAASADYRLRASFSIADAIPDWTPENCSLGSERIAATFSDETDAAALCPVADLDGMPLKGSYLDADGNPAYYAQGIVGSSADGYYFAESLTVETAGGAIRRASFARRDGQNFACSDGCAGLTVSAPDGAGWQRIGLAGVRMGELGSAGLAGDRSVVLDGSFEVQAPVAAKAAAQRAAPLAVRRTAPLKSRPPASR